ncbi:MAG: hypothetical protein DI629_02780 [Mesorhizobium amorphae]|nr:MAG: hypothetical protein DI629_02780 [Mesorhizobium amorphae]
MLSTFVTYQSITRDIAKTMARVEKQPVVERESAYFEKNIVKVASVDEFMSDSRLYRYAMKAFGLSDMTYATAFMRKALEGGVNDADSFANKLTDKRYARFVEAFNFSDRKAAALEAPAQDGVIARTNVQAFQKGVSLDNPTLLAQNKAYREGVAEITSIDGLLADNAVYSYAMRAFGLEDEIGDKDFMRSVLEGGISDPDSVANRTTDKRFLQFAAAFDFARHGEKTTTWRPAVEGAQENYVRQTLEEDAGAQNEGVRLALYFERNAGSINSFYSVLADKALAQVVRTVLSLPDSYAALDIERQHDFFASKLDVADFKDTDALGSFLKRFTALWEVQNGTAASSNASPAALFSQGAAFGVSTDLMLTMQTLRR